MWTMIADRVNEVEPLIARTHEFATRASLPEADVEAMGQRLAIAYRHRAMGAYAPGLQAGLEQNPHLRVYLPDARARAPAGRRPRRRRRVFEQLADFDAFPRDILWFSGDRAAGRGLRADRGHATARPSCTDPAAPYRHRIVVVGMASCFGSCERYLGLLARTRSDWAVAAEHFEAALAANAAAGIVSMERMARDDLIALLDERGETAARRGAAPEALGASELPPTEQV